MKPKVLDTYTRGNLHVLMRLSRRTCRGGPWHPLGRTTGTPVGPRGKFRGSSRGTPRYAMGSRGIPLEVLRLPSVYRGFPWDVPRVPVESNGFSWVPVGFHGKSRVPTGKNTITSITAVLETLRLNFFSFLYLKLFHVYFLFPCSFSPHFLLFCCRHDPCSHI